MLQNCSEKCLFFQLPSQKFFFSQMFYLNLLYYFVLSFTQFSTIFHHRLISHITINNPLLQRYLTHQQQTAFENIVRKGEITHNEQFLLFPQCFLLKQIIVSSFVHIFAIISLFGAELEKPKICISGKEYISCHREMNAVQKLSAILRKVFAKQGIMINDPLVSRSAYYWLRYQARPA